MPFISFSCLIAVDQTSDTMLSKSGKSECPCFVPDLRGNVPHFFTIETDVNMGLLYMPFVMLRYVPSVLTLRALGF